MFSNQIFTVPDKTGLINAKIFALCVNFMIYASVYLYCDSFYVAEYFCKQSLYLMVSFHSCHLSKSAALFVQKRLSNDGEAKSQHIIFTSRH